MEKNNWRAGARSLSRAIVRGTVLWAILWLVHLCAVAAPVNDNLANATVLAANWTAVTGTNVGATYEANEPNHVYAEQLPDGKYGRNSIWWKWTPNFSGQVQIDTFGSTDPENGTDGLDTELAVYIGNSMADFNNAGNVVAKNEDAPDSYGQRGGKSVVTFTALSGTTYYIAVAGYDNLDGTVHLNFSFIGAAPKYSLSTAVVPGGTGTIAVSPPQPAGGYDAGTVVTLTVSPTGTNQFSSWAGSVSGSGTSVQVAMNGPKGVTAVFNSNHQITLQNMNSRQIAYFLLRGGTFLASSMLHNGASLGPSWELAGSADFDNNGSPDPFFRHTDGRLAAWLMNGTSYGSSTLLAGGRQLSTVWTVVGTGHFDGNGSVDIVFQNSNGAVAVWLMNGTGYQSSAMIRGGASPGAGWRAAGAAILNGTTADIIFQHSDGRTMAWLLNGTTFGSELPIRSVGAGWRLFAFADLNGNNTPDFLWQHDDGRTVVWYMNGATYSSAGTIKAVAPAWRAKGAN